MRGPLLVAVSMFGLFSCEACQPVSTGPFNGLLALERWRRADPANEHTMTGLLTGHRDERLPRMEEVDPSCTAFVGNWLQSPSRQPSFGTVRMHGTAEGEVTWSADEEGAGWEASHGGLSWDTGSVLKVTASGGDLPAFEFEDTVPAQVMLTSHDLSALSANELHVSRSVPLELKWDPVSGEVLLLFLQFPAADATHKNLSVWCVYPASPGGVTVPTSVLGRLAPSTPKLSTNVYFGGVSAKRVTLEGVDLRTFTFKNEAARIQID